MHLHERTILILSANKNDKEILLKIIEGCGSVCITTSSIEECIHECQRSAPHLIIFDLSLQNPDGNNFIQESLKYSELRSIATIAIATIKEKKQLQDAFVNGLSDNIIRPITNTVVLQKIRKCFLKLKEPIKQSYALGTNNEIIIEAFGKLVSVNDETFVIESDLKFTNSAHPNVLSNLLENAGIKNIAFSVVESRPIHDGHGLYQSKIKLVGHTQADKDRLIKIIRSWHE